MEDLSSRSMGNHWKSTIQCLNLSSNEFICTSHIPLPWNACLTIKDYPRFGWRGLMLDVSRHFFTVEEVKQYLDQMAKFKFNVFHWHLTDDEGWRIEIKTFPKLTEVGAWRVARHGQAAPHASSAEHLGPPGWPGFQGTEGSGTSLQGGNSRSAAWASRG